MLSLYYSGPVCRTLLIFLASKLSEFIGFIIVYFARLLIDEERINPFQHCVVSYTNQSFFTQQSKWLVSMWNVTLSCNWLTHFMLILHFETPWKRGKTSGFWHFQGVKTRPWHKMVLLNSPDVIYSKRSLTLNTFLYV